MFELTTMNLLIAGVVCLVMAYIFVHNIRKELN